MDNLADSRFPLPPRRPSEAGHPAVATAPGAKGAPPEGRKPIEIMG